MRDNVELRWAEMVDGISTIHYSKVKDEEDFARQYEILANNPNVEEIVLYSAKVVYKKGE